MSTDLAEIAELLAEFTYDPLGCVLAAFPWGEGELVNEPGPRQWQCDELEQIASHLGNPLTRYTPYYSATVSGNGPGKSALVAFITKWALATCNDCRVIITANTGAQLATKTQPEVSKWFRMAIDRDAWEVGATQIRSTDPLHRDTWRADFNTWNEANPEAIGGLHNKGKRIVVIFDEASAIPRVIWDYIKGAMTDADTEILWFVFGNGTLNEGSFYECFHKNAHLWHHRSIDTRTIQGTNKEEIQKWLEEDGEDSDWFRVHVKGLFPRQSELQFISHAVVDAARKYRAVGYESQPKVLAADIARFGGAENVIGMRQGRKYQELESFRRQDTNYTTQRIIDHINTERPDAVVIDANGIGGAVVDSLRSLGYEVIGFDSSAQAYDSRKYGNRRAEIWAKTKFWLEAGASIPDDEKLAHQIAAPHFYYKQGQVQHNALMIERKEDMARRGEASPDHADTLCLTHAVDPAPKQAHDTHDRWSHMVPSGPQAWMG